MAWKQDNFAPEPGVDINLYRRIAKGQLKGVVQINHGMTEHAARYERFGDALAQAGYSTYAHDHRGHGYTKTPDSFLGSFAKQNGWTKVICDVAAINALAHQENPGVPVICFGHSMGSILSLNYAMRHPDTIQGLALWNSGVETGFLGAVFKTILKTQRMFKGSDVPSIMVKRLTFDTWNKTFKPNRTDFDWLSRDEAEVDKYVVDPLCGFDATIGLWLDIVEGIYFGADDSKLATLPKELPIHLQSGDLDPCTEKGKAMANIKDRMNKLGMADVTYELLTDTRHESLNELNQEATTAKFVAWLDARFG